MVLPVGTLAPPTVGPDAESVMYIPARSPIVLVMPVTIAEPLVNVPPIDRYVGPGPSLRFITPM